MSDALLHPTNHELMKLVRARISAKRSMTMIAAEMGVHVDDLCDWILDRYQEPKEKQKPYQNKAAAPILATHPGGGDRWSASENARRFASWKRAHDGAAKALGEASYSKVDSVTH